MPSFDLRLRSATVNGLDNAPSARKTHGSEIAALIGETLGLEVNGNR